MGDRRRYHDVGDDGLDGNVLDSWVEPALSSQPLEAAAALELRPLLALLAALTAPATAAELSRQETTVRAFAAERSRCRAEGHTPYRRAFRIRRSGKVAAATSAMVLACASAAAAATISALTVVLPHIQSHGLRSAAGATSLLSSAQSHTAASSGSPGGPHSSPTSTRAKSTRGGATSTAGSGVSGLCRSLQVRSGQSLSSTSMRRLAALAAAHGQTVSEYCVSVGAAGAGKGNGQGKGNSHGASGSPGKGHGSANGTSSTSAPKPHPSKGGPRGPNKTAAPHQAHGGSRNN